MPTSSPTTIAEQIDAVRVELHAQVPAPLLAAFDGQADALAARAFAAGAPQPGDAAPEFTLDDSAGAEHTLAGLLAEGPIVLTFYRGAWCPYCNVQLRAYAAARDEFSARGARVVAVSPQAPSTSEELREAAGLEFPVLVDPGARVAARFGLAFEVSPADRTPFQTAGLVVAGDNADGSWWLPTPGTFVIDAGGVVRYAGVDGDFRRRTEVSELLAAL